MNAFYPKWNELIFIQLFLKKKKQKKLRFSNISELKSKNQHYASIFHSRILGICPRKRWEMVQGLGSMPSTWAIQVKFLVPGIGMAQTWNSKQRLSLSFSLRICNSLFQTKKWTNQYFFKVTVSISIVNLLLKFYFFPQFCSVTWFTFLTSELVTDAQHFAQLCVFSYDFSM